MTRPRSLSENAQQHCAMKENWEFGNRTTAPSITKIECCLFKQYVSAQNKYGKKLKIIKWRFDQLNLSELIETTATERVKREKCSLYLLSIKETR